MLQFRRDRREGRTSTLCSKLMVMAEWAVCWLLFCFVKETSCTVRFFILSHYLKVRRTEYYDRLMAIRNDGDWEGWMKFFLRGVEEVSEEAISSSRKIFAMREQHREMVNSSLGNSAASGLRLLDYFYEQPIVNVRLVEKHLRSSFVTANRLVEQFVTLNILKETTGGQRNRRYSYFPYLALFESSVTAHRDEGASS